MALVSEHIKKCAVKIETTICGVESFGSGIVYETPNYCEYNYILTAKHILQEDSQTEYSKDKISSIVVYYNEKSTLKKLQYISKRELEKRIILFDDDLAIIIIDKSSKVNFSQFLVSDKIEDEEQEFFSWATFSANKDDLHLFNFERNDPESKRFKLKDNVSPEALPGISGGGIFSKKRNILYGIISRYPNEKFKLNTIDCVQKPFESINAKLKTLNKVQLDTKSSKNKREIKNSVVDIHQAVINNVCLDLELARKRLKIDIIDDWFHDPLKYIDLLNQDYLFKQFEDYFDNNTYKAAVAEQFYVPKKQFTLRQALISPFIDRIMYMAVVGVLAEKLDKSMIPSVFSARYNKFSEKQLIINGVEQWKKMQYALYEKVNRRDENDNFIYNCVIEIDLLNFYDNINKEFLITKIERVCETNNEKNACKLLGEILNKFSNKDSGLPQNSDASSLLAAFYLNQVDVYMQSRSFAYYRFMDDIRIFCKNKYEGRKILQEFEYELRRCYLSVNSQKTKIKSILDNPKDIKNQENQMLRSDFSEIFELELSKVARLRKSSNYAYLNEAFHQSIKLLKDNITEDINNSDISAKKLNYALNTIEYLGKKNINLYKQNSKFKQNLSTAVKYLLEKPWMTTQICKVLNLIDSNTIIEEYLSDLKKIILDDNFNTYAFQTYQIWLLLAKHKAKSDDLIQYAVNHIEKNDETNRVVIAGMVIYICSVDSNYTRVILRKFEEGFTHGYFQNRIALITLRKFDKDLVKSKEIDKSLQCAHEFTNRFRTKDLVYVQGFDESDDNEFIEQLYSI